MKVDIYRSASSSTKYLAVPANSDVTKYVFNPPLERDLLRLSPFKTLIEIVPGGPHIGLDPDDVLQQLNTKKYAVFGATVVIEIMA